MNISYFPAKDNQSYDEDAGCVVVQGGGCTVTHSQSGTGEHMPGRSLPEPIITSIPVKNMYIYEIQNSLFMTSF